MLLATLALPAFAVPDEELQYNYYDSLGNLVGGLYVGCSGPPFTSSWGQATDYFTLEILSVCQIWDPMPSCDYFGTEATDCPNYCVSSDYRVQVELNEITDACVN